MTTAMVQRDKVEAVRLPRATNAAAVSVVEHIGRTFAALPSFVDRERFAHAAVTAANELPADTNPLSVMTAALNCARMGLMPGAALGLAYFVPFKKQAQLVIGWKGFVDLAYRNRFLKSLHTECVLDGEAFERWNDEQGPHFRHPVPLDRAPAAKDNLVGAYAWGHLSTGGDFFQWVSVDDIKAVYSDASPAWRDHFGEMVMKTAVRRASKRWKLTPEMAMAVHLDEQAERGEQQAPIDSDDLEGVRRVTDRPGSLDDFDREGDDEQQ